MKKPVPNVYSHLIAPGLYLVAHEPEAAQAPVKPEPTNYFLLIDVSGSMWGDLPSLRNGIKSKLPSLIGEADTVTIEWFSGRGQFGVIVEGEKLATLKDLSKVNALIDRWLQPQGLTAFKEPIAEVKAIAARVNKANPGRNALLFLSDGMDNCWPRHEIIAAMKEVAPILSSATFVEYGLYADQPMLVSLAEVAGGTHIYAQDFLAFTPIFESAIQRGRAAAGGGRVGLVLDSFPTGGFAYALDADTVNTFAADEICESRTGKVVGAGVSVPKGTPCVYYLSETPVGQCVGHASEAALYAAMGLFATRMKPKIVWGLLRKLADVEFIDEYSIAFGKQRLNAFAEHCFAAAFDPAKRRVKGVDPTRVPREDATTVIDIFSVLASDDRCRILTESDAFTYSRIGRKAVSKADMLTVTESGEVETIITDLKATLSTREVSPLRDAVEKLTAILARRKEPLRFLLDKEAAEAGYSVLDMVWNQSMPNLSFRVRQPGTVDIYARADVPEDVRRALPSVIPTYRYRTYTVVKDGFVHLEWLPVRVPQSVLDTLVAIGAVDLSVDLVSIVDGEAGIFQLVIDLRRTPVVNQKMVKDVSAIEFAERTWSLLQLEAAAKVWGFYTPKRESKGFATVYGPAAAKWLDENGVTDHSGFKVDSTSAPPTDFYLVKALDVKIPGFSSLPSVKETRERMEAVAEQDVVLKSGGKVKGKLKELTPGMKLMEPYLREVDKFMASDVFQNAANRDALFTQWVSDKAKQAVAQKRGLQTENAKTVFTITVANTWFKEFASLAEDKLTIPLGGEAREVTFALNAEKKIEI